MSAGGPSLLRRLSWLPARERALVVVALLVAPTPALGAFFFRTSLGWVAEHPASLPLVTAVLLLGVLLAFEPPPSPTFRDYLQHLATRFNVVQAHYTAALERHLAKGNTQ